MSQTAAGTAIRCARRSLGISVATASKLAGVSSSTVKRWEAGIGVPGSGELQRYLDAIGTPAESPYRGDAGGAGEDIEGAERPLFRMLRAKRRRDLRTLEDISASTGISLASLHRYETGERVPDPDTVTRLAQAYGCTAEESRLLSANEEATPPGSLVENFISPGKLPHYWVYKRLESVAHSGAQLTCDEAVDLMHGLMIMGDHRGVLEAWNIVRPSMEGLPFTIDRKAEIAMSLILARFTVSRDVTKARERIAKWQDYAEDLPSGSASARAMSHLTRVAAALGELDEAEKWLSRLESHAERSGDGGHLFVCAVNRALLAFNRAPSEAILRSLNGLRAHAVGPLQIYTGDVAALYMYDRLGDTTSARAMLDGCHAAESAYGFGSPLASRIRLRYRRAYAA